MKLLVTVLLFFQARKESLSDSKDCVEDVKSLVEGKCFIYFFFFSV